MEKLNCPHCNGEVLNDVRLAGQVVSCPTCRKPFRMPEAPATGGAFNFEGSAPVSSPPQMAPAAPPRQTVPAGSPPRQTPAPQQTPSQPAEEPWYYGFLEKYAKVLMWLGVLLSLFALFLVLLSAVLAFTSGEPITAINAIMKIAWTCAGVLTIVLVLVSFLFAVALIQLAVDAGRNLRAICREEEE